MANSSPDNWKHFTAFRSAAEEVEGRKSAHAREDDHVSNSPPPESSSSSTTTVTAASSQCAPAERAPAELNRGSAGVREVGTPDAHGTSRYCIRFYNEISDSTGRANHVCQRELEVATALGEDEAIALAIMEFEKLESTSSWTTHARTIECTLITAR